MYAKHHDFGQANLYLPTVIWNRMPAAQSSDRVTPATPIRSSYVFSVLISSAEGSLVHIPSRAATLQVSARSGPHNQSQAPIQDTRPPAREAFPFYDMSARKPPKFHPAAIRTSAVFVTRRGYLPGLASKYIDRLALLLSPVLRLLWSAAAVPRPATAVVGQALLASGFPPLYPCLRFLKVALFSGRGRLN